MANPSCVLFRLLAASLLLVKPCHAFLPVATKRASSIDNINTVGSHQRLAATVDHYEGPPVRVVRCFPNLSRREAEQAVAEGRVRVDGNVIAPGYRLVGGQELMLGNKKIPWEPIARALQLEGGKNSGDEKGPLSPLVYFKYHKPLGVACTMDKHDRRGLWYSLPKSARQKDKQIFPVGRLDLDSEGLVILTNDGRLADALLQPKYKEDKEYIVSIRPPGISHENLERLQSGVVITTTQQRTGQETTEVTRPCMVEALDDSRQTLRFVLHEGRNRQIRKMISAVGSDVTSLKRIRHGIVSLDDVPSGGIVPLSDSELALLTASVKQRQENKNRLIRGSRKNFSRNSTKRH